MIDKELLAACKTAAEQIRRCDYTPARSTLLTAIKNAEAAMAEPQPDADGWINWNGGKCPLPNGTIIDVRFGYGGEILSRRWPAEFYRWSCHGDSSDIIAYRTVEGD